MQLERVCCDREEIPKGNNNNDNNGNKNKSQRNELQEKKYQQIY
jgi:hypothetical protein